MFRWYLQVLISFTDAMYCRGNVSQCHYDHYWRTGCLFWLQ